MSWPGVVVRPAVVSGHVVELSDVGMLLLKLLLVLKVEDHCDELLVARCQLSDGGKGLVHAGCVGGCALACGAPGGFRAGLMCATTGCGHLDANRT